jgi:hypothetical protein
MAIYNPGSAFVAGSNYGPRPGDSYGNFHYCSLPRFSNGNKMKNITNNN